MVLQKSKFHPRFKKLASDLIYRARIFELKAVTTRAPDGHHFRHDVVFHPGAAVIVPILERDRFILIKQYRVATSRVIWEFPAGTLEAGEAPLACAKREIIEEIGFQAKKWQKLVSFYPAPGISTEFMHIFLASNLTPRQNQLDKDEFIETEIVSFQRLQKMIFNDTIVDAKTMIGFFYYCQKFKVC